MIRVVGEWSYHWLASGIEFADLSSPFILRMQILQAGLAFFLYFSSYHILVSNTLLEMIFIEWLIPGRIDEITILLADSLQILFLPPDTRFKIQRDRPDMNNPVVPADCKHTNCQIPFSTSLALNGHSFLGVNPDETLNKRHLALQVLLLAMFLDDEVEV